MTLRERRVKAGYTVEGLAQLAGVSPGMVSMLESGKRGLSAKTAKKLAEVYSLKKWWALVEEHERSMERESA